MSAVEVLRLKPSVTAEECRKGTREVIGDDRVDYCSLLRLLNQSEFVLRSKYCWQRAIEDDCVLVFEIFGIEFGLPRCTPSTEKYDISARLLFHCLHEFLVCTLS